MVSFGGLFREFFKLSTVHEPVRRICVVSDGPAEDIWPPGDPGTC